MGLEGATSGGGPSIGVPFCGTFSNVHQDAGVLSPPSHIPCWVYWGSLQCFLRQTDYSWRQAPWERQETKSEALNQTAG